MIKIHSNINKSLLNIVSKIQSYQDINGVIHDKLTRALASSAAGIVRKRVHKDGINSAGTQIGTYSEQYMKIRESKKYNRTSSKKIIFSLTSQMEQDLSVSIGNPIKTEKGYGIGFKNELNLKKSQWLQERFGNVYPLTDGEKIILLEAAKEFIDTVHA